MAEHTRTKVIAMMDGWKWHWPRILKGRQITITIVSGDPYETITVHL